jgi:hypothetical protein
MFNINNKVYAIFLSPRHSITRQTIMDLVPLVRVLPFSRSKKEMKPSDTAIYQDGLLAWGNMNTARHHGGLFDDILVTAEEFPFEDSLFVQNVLCNTVRQPPVKVYHIPISEEVRNNVVREQNSLAQPVHSVVCVNQTPVKSIIQPIIKSNQLILSCLLQRRRVLVVCMAGRNRSTATLLRFLLLLSAQRDVTAKTVTPMLLDAYHHGKPGSEPWSCEEWESYLSSKRDYEIFPLNRVQIDNLCHTIREINLDFTMNLQAKPKQKAKDKPSQSHDPKSLATYPSSPKIPSVKLTQVYTGKAGGAVQSSLSTKNRSTKRTMIA